MKRNPRSTKAPYNCRGGPLNGHTLYLEDPGTVVFTMRGQTGRYVQAGNVIDLKWKPQT